MKEMGSPICGRTGTATIGPPSSGSPHDRLTLTRCISWCMGHVVSGVHRLGERTHRRASCDTSRTQRRLIDATGARRYGRAVVSGRHTWTASSGTFGMRGTPGIAEPSDRARDPETAARLWDVSEELTDRRGLGRLSPIHRTSLGTQQTPSSRSESETRSSESERKRRPTPHGTDETDSRRNERCGPRQRRRHRRVREPGGSRSVQCRRQRRTPRPAAD